MVNDRVDAIIFSAFKDEQIVEIIELGKYKGQNAYAIRYDGRKWALGGPFVVVDNGSEARMLHPREGRRCWEKAIKRGSVVLGEDELYHDPR